MGRPKQFDPDTAVEQAMNVFWRQGYGATTPAQLVDALGIGKGSLYNTFGGKRELFELALRRYLDQRIAAVSALLDSTAPTKNLIREALKLLVDSEIADPDRRGCLATNSAAEFGVTDEVVAMQVRYLFDRSEDIFRALLEKGQRNNEIRADLDAGAGAAMLLNTITGIHLLSRVEPNADRLNKVVDATVSLL